MSKQLYFLWVQITLNKINRTIQAIMHHTQVSKRLEFLLLVSLPNDQSEMISITFFK